MIERFSINPGQVQRYTEVKLSGAEILEGFPLISIDTDSYVVDAEIQSGINFDVAGGRHFLTMGKGCALADGITFMINMNHDYSTVRNRSLCYRK